MQNPYYMQSTGFVSYQNYNQQEAQIPMTQAQVSTRATEALRNMVRNDGIEFNFDDTSENFCTEHSEIKEYILMQDYDNYKKYQTICSLCKSKLESKLSSRGVEVKSKLMSHVILENKEKILKIKENKIDLSSVNRSVDLNSIVFDQIMPLADELFILCEQFNREICENITGLSAKNDDLKKIQAFVNDIELTSNYEPNVFGIGPRTDLKHKYIKLALFLLGFSGLPANSVGITAKFKKLLDEIVRLRNIINNNFTAWLRFLLGDFFDYIFSLEKVSVDFGYKENFPIEMFNNEQELMRLRGTFELELRKRDERIRFLEEENMRMKRDLELLTGSLVQRGNHDNIIADLQLKLRQLEQEWNYQKTTVVSLSNENQRLAQINTDIMSQLNDWKAKYLNLEAKYNSDLQFLNQEKDGFNGRMSVINQKYETEIKVFREQITVYNSEITNLKGQINSYVTQLSAVSRERDILKSQVDGLKAQLTIIQTNIDNLGITINIVTSERDEARNQVMIVRGEYEKFKSENANFMNLKVAYEARIKDLEAKLNQLADIYSKLQSEFNNKLLAIRNFEAEVANLNTTISNHQSQIDVYSYQIKNYERLLIEKEDQIKRLTEENLTIKDKDEEIATLKMTITSCKDEWNKLSDSYQNLLVDIKNQISINELLRNLVYELTSKIEMHNQQVGGLDALIKQQIEILTRQTLSKKTIDVNNKNNTDVIKKASGEADTIRNKVGRIESQKLFKSAVFDNINLTLDDEKKMSRKNSINMVSSGNPSIVKSIEQRNYAPNLVSSGQMFSNNYPNQGGNNFVQGNYNYQELVNRISNANSTVANSNSNSLIATNNNTTTTIITGNQANQTTSRTSSSYNVKEAEVVYNYAPDKSHVNQVTHVKTNYNVDSKASTENLLSRDPDVKSVGASNYSTAKEVDSTLNDKEIDLTTEKLAATVKLEANQYIYQNPNFNN